MRYDASAGLVLFGTVEGRLTVCFRVWEKRSSRPPLNSIWRRIVGGVGEDMFFQDWGGMSRRGDNLEGRVHVDDPGLRRINLFDPDVQHVSAPERGMSLSF